MRAKRRSRWGSYQHLSVDSRAGAGGRWKVPAKTPPQVGGRMLVLWAPENQHSAHQASTMSTCGKRWRSLWEGEGKGQ